MISNSALDKREVATEVSIQPVLLDADLFVKYRSSEKAFSLLRESMERSPRYGFDFIPRKQQNIVRFSFPLAL